MRWRRAWRLTASAVAVMALAFATARLWPRIADQLALSSRPAVTATGRVSPDRPSATAFDPTSTTFKCQVAYVHDGDTFRCADGMRVRLHAVAARELDETCSPGHPCPAASAKAAKAELERLAGGRMLRCVKVGTSYDRTTAICWTPGGTQINCAMVRSGTTVLWDRFDRQQPICAR